MVEVPLRRRATVADRPGRIRRVVASIPAGCVATYGQVADLAGLGRGARQVGRVLAALPEGTDLPWQRVIAATGRLALPAGSPAFRTQVRLLRAEGVAVRRGRVDLARHGWRPDLDELLWGPAPAAMP